MYFNEIGLNTVAISILTAALIFLGAAYWRLQNKKDQKAIDEKSTAADIQKQLNENSGESWKFLDSRYSRLLPRCPQCWSSS